MKGNIAFLYSYIDRYIIKYCKIYDPGFFSLIYSFKAIMSIILSSIISYIFFDEYVLPWASFMPMYIFFLNAMISDKDSKILYLFIFVIFTCFAAFIFSLMAGFEGGILLFIPASLLGFFVGITLAYNEDLSKVLGTALINALVASIYAFSNVNINLRDEISIIFISGCIAIFFRFFISFGKYGKFTIKVFSGLLFNIRHMLEEILDNDSYLESSRHTLDQINKVKLQLSSNAAKIKDSHLIKDLKRAIFYLYRVEEIYQSINAIHSYALDNKGDEILERIIAELIYNINELSGIFYGKVPHLKKSTLNEVLESRESTLQASLLIIYTKIDAFLKANDADVYFKPPQREKKRIKDIIKEIFASTNLYNKYAIKYAMVIGISVLFSTYLKIDHGIWIALGTISIMRPHFRATKNAGKNYLIGSYLGVAIGFLLVFLFKGSLIFYPIFIIIIFCIIYLKVFPYTVWIASLSIGFVMMLSIVSNELIGLIVLRVIGIFVGLLIVLLVFLILMPKNQDLDTSELFSSVFISLESLLSSTQLIFLDSNKSNFINRQSYLLKDMSKLNENILILKEERDISYSRDDIKLFAKAYKLISFINQHIIMINEYLLHLSESKKSLEKELFLHDLKSLEIRFNMLDKMVNNKPYIIRTREQFKFLSKDERFVKIAGLIFDTQFKIHNTLYKSLRQ